MKRLLTSILWIAGVSAAAWATVVAATPAQPVKLSAAAAATVLKEIDKDRTDTQKWLQSDPTSYLATIDRRDFEQKKMLTVGRAADNDVRIDDPAVAAHHLKVTLEGDAFHVVALDQDARFKIPGDKDAKIWQEKRDATVDPSSLQIGRFLLRLSHQRYPAIIVFDPQSPRFKLYKGLKYFPPDLSYRYELALTPNPKPETTVIMSTRGNQRRADKVGWFDFVVGTTTVRLEAVRLLEPGVGENDLGIFFRDTTTGKESYELGRYVDVKKLANGKYLLDFNFTYNPACAYSDHYNCPIPPKANVLPVAIRAGEMDAHYH
jgi:uncharacterized protein (DUF1684 family)